MALRLAVTELAKDLPWSPVLIDGSDRDEETLADLPLIMHRCGRPGSTIPIGGVRILRQG